MERKTNHRQLSDNQFMEQFRNGSFDPELFNHEAHLRLAWLSIDRFGLDQAEENIQHQLQRYVEIVGAKDKYHMTLTIVALKIVNHFMKKSKSDNFHDFIEEFPKLKYAFQELINAHYSYNIFTSDKARSMFLEPDLLTFD